MKQQISETYGLLSPTPQVMVMEQHPGSPLPKWCDQMLAPRTALGRKIAPA